MSTGKARAGQACVPGPTGGGQWLVSGFSSERVDGQRSDGSPFQASDIFFFKRAVSIGFPWDLGLVPRAARSQNQQAPH